MGGPWSVGPDFNGDGNLDVAVADAGLNKVSILLGSANGTLTAGSVPDITVGTAPVALAVGDFIGNGKLDLAVVNSGSNTVSILLGNGNGTFTTGQTISVGTNPVAIVVGNFDGKLDLVVANKGSNTLSVLLGNGDGTFQSPSTIV